MRLLMGRLLARIIAGRYDSPGGLLVFNSVLFFFQEWFRI
jgi:hypothetical protein